jgi:membrane-bound serine protease (ClpP class)
MWLAIGLAAAGIVAIIVEVFLPTAGLLGIAGLASIVASIVIIYHRFGSLAGSLYLAAVMVLTPALLVLYFKLFPRSVIGRWLISRHAHQTEQGPFAELAEQEGRTLTVLHPVGVILIGEKKLSAVTAGELVEKDRRVRVIKVEGSRIVVREISGGET